MVKRFDFIFVFFISVFCFSHLLFATESFPYGKAPEFKLVERSGKEISLSDLKGHVWIANFIFTRCQTMCPLMTRQMALLQKKLSDVSIYFISFSVDPQHDTPEVLSKYASQYGADSEKWFFLTGERKEIWKLVAEGFHLGVDDATPEEIEKGAQPILHSDRFVLVDQTGTIRGFFNSSEPAKLDELVRKAKELLSENP